MVLTNILPSDLWMWRTTGNCSLIKATASWNTWIAKYTERWKISTGIFYSPNISPIEWSSQLGNITSYFCVKNFFPISFLLHFQSKEPMGRTPIFLLLSFVNLVFFYIQLFGSTLQVKLILFFPLWQATEVDDLKHKLAELTESKEQLELRNQKLAEESSYAKGLASAAAVELKALSEEVAKLMNENERLASELATSKSSPSQRKSSIGMRNGRREVISKRTDIGPSAAELKRELAVSKERELSYEAALLEKDHRETELQRKVEESKQREAYLENELANMWVLVAKLKKSHGNDTDDHSTRDTQRLDDDRLIWSNCKHYKWKWSTMLLFVCVWGVRESESEMYKKGVLHHHIGVFVYNKVGMLSFIRKKILFLLFSLLHCLFYERIHFQCKCRHWLDICFVHVCWICSVCLLA